MPTLATLNPVQNQIVNNFGPGFLPFFPADDLVEKSDAVLSRQQRPRPRLQHRSLFR